MINSTLQHSVDFSMNIRTKFLFGFFGACFCGVILLAVTVLLVPRFPLIRWALLPEWAAIFVFAYWWIRRFRGRLPKPSQTERSKAARSARNAGIFFIVAPALGYLTRGSELITLPHGLGFILPLIPLALATFYLRLYSQLRRDPHEEAKAPTP